MWAVIFFAILITAYTQPLPGHEPNHQTAGDAQEVDPEQIMQYQKDIDVVSYIQNFKNIMAEYVNTQYKNLTINEMEAVKSSLEQFLMGFAKDLRQVIARQDANANGTGAGLVEDKIEDGLSDTTFDEIKTRIQTEFPDIREDTAREIVYRLRRNLFATRQRIDNIIKDSQQSQIDNLKD